jgi:hypothetical protein
MVPLQVAGGGERELTAITLQVSELLLLTMKILSAKTVFACAIIASVALAHSRPAGLEVTIKLLKMVACDNSHNGRHCFLDAASSPCGRQQAVQPKSLWSFLLWIAGLYKVVQVGTHKAARLRCFLRCARGRALNFSAICLCAGW